MDKQTSNQSWFYSTFSNDIQKMLLDGDRVAAWIESTARNILKGLSKVQLARLIANVSLEKIRLT